MHCMMTEFLGDWPKPKTLDRCSLGPLHRRSGEAGDTEPGPGAGFCSCESIPARAERARLLCVCPSPGQGLGAGVWSLGSSPPSASISGAAGGERTPASVRGAPCPTPLGGERLSLVCNTAAELLRALKIPRRC